MNDSADNKVFGLADDAPEHEIAAHTLRAMIHARGVTQDCVPVMATPFTDAEWAKKVKAAQVQCRVSAPSTKFPFIVHYSAGIGIWLPDVLKKSASRRHAVHQAQRDYGKKRPWHDYTAYQPLLEECRRAWKPDVFAVISGCLSDSNALEYHGGFENWASDLGYDQDSRKALANYEECQRIGREMRALFGSDFDRARELAGQL